MTIPEGWPFPALGLCALKTSCARPRAKKRPSSEVTLQFGLSLLVLKMTGKVIQPASHERPVWQNV
jgi:hypothetical protein